MTEDLAVWTAVTEAAASGEPVVLATIVSAKGSTPRGVGSKMVYGPETGLVGTVGGGCGEAEVIEAATAALRDGATRTVRIDLTRDFMSLSPAVCGGVFDVLVEPVLPGEDRPHEQPEPGST